MILYSKILRANQSVEKTILGGLFKIEKNNRFGRIKFIGIQIFRKKMYQPESELLKIALNEIAILRKDVTKLLCEQHMAGTVQEQHMKVFPAYKNKHIGKVASIVATGPTALYYQPVQDVVHIGVNATCNMENIPLDYWFGADMLGIRDYIDGIKKLTCPKFMGQCTHIRYDAPHYYANDQEKTPRIIPDSLIESIPGAQKYYFKTGMPALSRNIAIEPIYNFCSVVYSALTFALWLGCKTIYLVGCDCALNGYFNGKKQTKDFPPNSLIRDWKIVAKSLKLLYPDVKIISINPVGLKGLFTDVYTREYLEAHPDIDKNNIQILDTV